MFIPQHLLDSSIARLLSSQELDMCRQHCSVVYMIDKLRMQKTFKVEQHWWALTSKSIGSCHSDKTRQLDAEVIMHSFCSNFRACCK